MTAALRLATPGDAEGLLEIYAPFCRDTAVTFEIEPPSPAEMAERIAVAHGAARPWLVAEDDGRLMGFAGAGRFHERVAYRWSVEVSVYVAAGWRRCGVGRGLYTALTGILTLQGYVNAFAAITVPNPASVAFHEALGFAPIGVFRHAGWKLEAWHDVGWWSLVLHPPEADPREPKPLDAARELPTWETALVTGARLIRP